MRTAAHSACRDCGQPPTGGPGDNRFTAYDAICRGDSCRVAGVPQVFVNLANLTLYIAVTDLSFGGPAPGFAIERAYNQDDPGDGLFGPGWSLNLSDRLTADSNGNLVLRRGSGRTDRFSPAITGGYFAVTPTADTLVRNSDGTYTLRAQASNTSRVFNADGSLRAVLDSGAVRVSLDYDSASRLSTAHYRGRTAQFSYDSQNRISTISDSAGRSVGYTYTAGRLSHQVNADGQTVDYTYDAAGNLTGITYSGGTIAVEYTSDPPFTSVDMVTLPDGTARKYDTPLSPTQIRLVDGNGDATLYSSNTAGLLLSVTDANGNTISYTYDAAGRRTSVVNGAGETTRFGFDNAGNLNAITDSGGNRWSADYSSGALAHITDPIGNTWSFQFDAAGNLTSAGDPLGGTVTLAGDAGKVTLTDALGNPSVFQINSDGLVSGFTDPLGGSWSYEYDGAARVKSRTDPGGASLGASYDASNRATAFTVGDATFPVDRAGFARDPLGRLSTYTDSFGNQLAYQYDGNGQLAYLTLPGGKQVHYQYDHAHRLSTVTDWLGNFAVYRYDAAGSPVSVSASGGPVTIYQYDAARRLRAIVSTGPDGAPVADYRFTLDPAGNRTRVTALEPSASAPTLSSTGLTFDPANHPTSRTDGQVYDYDARGNLKSIRGTRNVTFAYDPLGRLQSLSGDISDAYTYDAAGLRVARSGRRYLNDPSGAQPRLVAELDTSNNPSAWYVYGLGLLWKIAADGTTYFYHFDADGNVVAMSNSARGVVNRYRYDPLGRLVTVDESVDNPFRARGEAGWVDDGNGLIYTGRAFLFPDLRLTLPAAADSAPPIPAIVPHLPGAGACFLDGVAGCALGSGRVAR